jgi:SAM-dependent methyltransferase
MRDLIGGVGPEAFDNPSRAPVYDFLPAEAYESVFDFGCGCGRVARQLILQRPRPRRYLGVDLHAGMIEWCRSELAPHAPGFRFEHHDIHNAGLNPEGRHRTLPLPAGDGEFTLFNAISVFTHSTQDQAEHYLREAARVMRPDGWLHASWFLFDKRLFPMMQPFQNALFINETDPTNAVIFDREWLRDTARALDLVVTWARPPRLRGFQWNLVMRRAGVAAEVDLPEDTAPIGRRPPPLTPADAADIGR